MQVLSFANDVLKQSKETGILLRQLPYVNFYQYPPPRPINPFGHCDLTEDLALDRSLGTDQTFTIFVSIPFCRSKCHSCRFFKGLLPSHVDQYAFLDDYLDCIEKQIHKYSVSVRFSTAHCGAVYIGGGTASVLDPGQVNRLVHTIRKSFSLDTEAEITLEGNPHDFSLEYFQAIRAGGVNRVSIGYQSCQDNILKKILNSPHNGKAGVQAVRNALSVGFHSVNMDLLYQIPGQTFDQWRYDIENTLSFETSNVTIYPYQIHRGSASERLIASGRLNLPVDAGTAHEWYLWGKKELERHGYCEQRKGLFCKPGHRQRYGDLSYTMGCEIVGLGAGAYSFVNGYQYNASDNRTVFMDQIQKGIFPPASKLSTQATTRIMMERFIIFKFFSFSLNRKDFLNHFGVDPLSAFPDTFYNLEKTGLIVISNDEIKLTDQGVKWRPNVLYEFYSFK